jgi:hypothetical protein
MEWHNKHPACHMSQNNVRPSLALFSVTLFSKEPEKFLAAERWACDQMASETVSE